jgi:rhamnogalacturonyl hydrolase YesR
MKYNFLILGWICAALVTAARGDENAAPEQPFAEWGHQAMADLDRHLYIDIRGLYAEEASLDRRRRREPAFLWGSGVQLSALAAATRVDRDKYAQRLTSYADQLQRYWHTDGDVPGYSVLPDSPSADRYYDDNAWIVLGFIETHEITGDQKYLDRAMGAMQFVSSGEDDRLGGGIYWRESPKESKNTCSNAPGIVCALRLYQATGDEQYLAQADRIYSWTNEHLQDNQDGLYWDNMRINGRVDRRKFSYNTALMIRANCLLFEIKQDKAYLNEARRLSQASVDYWIDPETGAMSDSGKFAHMLLEALLAVDKLDAESDWKPTVSKSLAFVHNELRDARGRYPRRWDGRRDRDANTMTLLDQASAVRAFFMLALAETGDN